MKPLLAGCVAVLLGLSLGTIGALGQTGASAAEAPRLPLPPGPLGIGRVGYHWVDDRRLDSDTQSARELMVYFWYPSSAKPAATRGAYLPGAKRMDELDDVRARMARHFGSLWPEVVGGGLFSHAAEGAPVAPPSRARPVVIFSHGVGSSGFSYTVLIEALVSHGYVVASIEHTYTAMAVWFPNGSVVTRRQPAAPSGLNPREKAEWMGKQMSLGIAEGAADVRFVLDRMTLENRNKKQFWLAGKLDLDRVAAMGHSAGAAFAARACQLDSRFKVCVDLDGAMVPVAALPDYDDGAKLQQPLLFLEAFHPPSQMGGTPDQQAAYVKKKEEQLQTSRPGSYNVVLRSPGIAHPSFSDDPLLFAGQNGYPERPVVLHNLELIERYVLEFLGGQLKQQATPLLNTEIDLPEVSIRRYGR